MKTVSLLHPFTPKAAGVIEKSVPTDHSQPHVKALRNISGNYSCAITYFTPKLFKYSISESGIIWNFFPVSYALNGDYKKWKKQFSKSCLTHFEKETPDITIINMSGHSSRFSYEISKIILKKNKQYIAMLGGQEYNDAQWIIDYYKNANHVLVHTDLQKNEMLGMEMFKNIDIRVFPLGVDCTDFTPINQKKTSVLESPKLLYVGKIVEWKRVHLSIEALNYLIKNGFPHATLKIIGPVVSQNYFLQLKQQIANYNISNQVTFEGQIVHDKLPVHFQNADLLLLPSDKETFGMVMIESMACGTPVAAINCIGGPLDVITNNIDGILSSVDTYVKDIFNLFLNRDLFQSLKTNARKTVLEKYSIEKTTTVLLESINSSLPTL